MEEEPYTWKVTNGPHKGHVRTSLGVWGRVEHVKCSCGDLDTRPAPDEEAE